MRLYRFILLKSFFFLFWQIACVFARRAFYHSAARERDYFVVVLVLFYLALWFFSPSLSPCVWVFFVATFSLSLQQTIINLCYDKWNGMICIAYFIYTRAQTCVTWFLWDRHRRHHHSHSIFSRIIHIKFLCYVWFSLSLSLTCWFVWFVCFFSYTILRWKSGQEWSELLKLRAHQCGECVNGQIYAFNGIFLSKLAKSRLRKANFATILA